MSIGIHGCTKCGRVYNHEKLARCPRCGANQTFDDQPQEHIVLSDIGPRGSVDKKCVACAELIKFEAQLCKHCGTMQTDLRFSKAASTSASPAKSGKGVCPKCEMSDGVKSVATIVDSGTSNSTSVTLLGQMGHLQNAYAGISLGSSSTALAQRLSVFVPEARFRFLSLLAGCILSVFAAMNLWFYKGGPLDCGSDLFNAGFAFFVSLFIGPVIGLILGIVVKEIEKIQLRPQQQAATRAIRTLRDSFYCSRDDLVFNGFISGKPEEFINKLLS